MGALRWAARRGWRVAGQGVHQWPGAVAHGHDDRVSSRGDNWQRISTFVLLSTGAACCGQWRASRSVLYAGAGGIVWRGPTWASDTFTRRRRADEALDTRGVVGAKVAASGLKGQHELPIAPRECDRGRLRSCCFVSRRWRLDCCRSGTTVHTAPPNSRHDHASPPEPTVATPLVHRASTAAVRNFTRGGGGRDNR